jgi:hypothetical protein
MADRYVICCTTGYKGSTVRRKKVASAEWMVLDSLYCYQTIYHSDMVGAELRAKRLCKHLNDGGSFPARGGSRQTLFAKLAAKVNFA